MIGRAVRGRAIFVVQTHCTGVMVRTPTALRAVPAGGAAVGRAGFVGAGAARGTIKHFRRPPYYVECGLFTTSLPLSVPSTSSPRPSQDHRGSTGLFRSIERSICALLSKARNLLPLHLCVRSPTASSHSPATYIPLPPMAHRTPPIGPASSEREGRGHTPLRSPAHCGKFYNRVCNSIPRVLGNESRT